MAQQRSGLRCARGKIVWCVATGLLLLAGARAGAEGNSPATEAAKLGVGGAEADRRWKSARATVFWVGESETEDNDHIANFKSAWDANWVAHFGGIDDPDDRCGFAPCGFKPKENPFYVALPFDDMEESGRRKAVTAVIPWDKPGAKQSQLKNRWVAVRTEGVTCYAQWQDVGPFEKDDADYVFGVAARPKNSKGEAAGIDLSPAVRDCLNVGGIAEVKWRHVEAHEVPHGPWKHTVTKRPGP
jgi:hypothetical protein